VKRFLLASLILMFAFFAVQPATAQQSFQKWDSYFGYSYLNTPDNSISQQGYNMSFGRNINHWLALGLDYSHFNGSGMQTAPVLPTLTLHVPYDASTSTFAAGTQFQVRKTKWVTPFFRPFLGAFHSSAKAKPDQIKLPAGIPAAALTQILAAIPASELKKSDTVLGYGVGMGVDLNITRPIGIRFATDYIRTSLFDEKQNNVRIAVGLIYRFGGDVVRR
jgi:opacity protein-like surface antigen